jgi:glycosyltransferase involved in cell wall biosynthesis
MNEYESLAIIRSGGPLTMNHQPSLAKPVHQSSILNLHSSQAKPVHQPSIISHFCQSQSISHQSSVIAGKASSVIWIINPFDQLPSESDVPLRYWALCRTFAEQGHEVIWWSSDFSHLTKSKRAACPDTDGFSVRLIETPPYIKNISIARLKNHKAFADGFYRDAMAGLKSGELKAPDRIVVSLPPLGVAEKAFAIRDFINQSSLISHQPSPTEPALNHQPSVISHPTTTSRCEVVVDIMDAWPETFYQALPKPLRKILGPILLAPMHRSAKRAYIGADKITAVGQSYLDLAQQYLGHQSSAISHQSSAISHQPSQAKPVHLCYHGTELDRFQRSRSGKVERPEGGKVEQSESQKSGSSQADLPEVGQSSVISHSLSAIRKAPLRAVYLGAMGSGYDLKTIIEVAARWKAEGAFPYQIHFAGTGSQLETLKAECERLGLTTRGSCRFTEDEKSDKSVASPSNQPSHLQTYPPSNLPTSARIVFHGHLGKTPITVLLESSDVALVPNRPGSLVACPYKAGEYAAAGLPMLSCLGAELNDLLKQWNAGSEYNEGDVESLHTAFEKYSTDLELFKQHSRNARKMAEALFDRERTYPELAEFILESNS